MGDIGGVAQAGASMADTAMTNAANVQLQNQANQFNAQQAGIQRGWSAEQAQKQMDFNAQQAQITRGYQTGERVAAQDYNTLMSDTAIQRRSTDLQKAGFNPLLAVSQLGGASTPISQGMGGATATGALPSGSTASAAGVARMQADPVLSALANLDLTNAQKAKTTQETKTEANKTQLTGYQAIVARTDADIAQLNDTPDMLMKKQQTLSAQLERDYSLAPDEAKIVANARLTAERAYEAQSLDLQGKQLGNRGQQLVNEWQSQQNQLSQLRLTAQRALNDQYIQAQRAAYERDQTDAGIENAILQGRKTGYGTAADGLAYLRALHSPVSSATSALGNVVGAANRLQYPTQGR